MGEKTASKRVGILGGGTAGATIAIRLAALGLETYLFEKKTSLIDGPPMCHLHAGGNLYREIPDEDCVALLKQCIDILRLYPYTIDVRPTVFAIPTRDEGLPEDLLPRLDILTQAYRDLIAQDPNNKVLGEPEDYYQLYSHERLIELSEREQVAVPKTLDEWVIPVAKHLDLNKVKYPL
ncbi:MAG: FAD-dependent oxidoreductase, partial [Psychrobacter sp.]